MRAMLALLIMSLAVGCAPTASVTPNAFGNSATLSMSLEAAFARTMGILADQKPVIRSATFTHIVITTPAATRRLTETQADCGTDSGRPYLTDNRTVTEVAYSVRLRGDGSRTSITVNAKIAGHLKATPTQQTATELSCVSRGGLERDLIAKIRQEPPSGGSPTFIEPEPE